MPDNYIFVFEYARRGETNHWDATDEGTRLKVPDAGQWPDREPSVEQYGHGGLVVISLRCDEAMDEDDAGIAEDVADEALKVKFPGAVIHYQNG